MQVSMMVMVIRLLAFLALQVFLSMQKSKWFGFTNTLFAVCRIRLLWLYDLYRPDCANHNGFFTAFNSGSNQFCHLFSMQGKGYREKQQRNK
jgi:hypothetical protein